MNPRDSAAAKAKAKKLMSEDPKAAEKALDWIKYRESTTLTNSLILAHALGLQKDPSRGHTHMIFRELEYRPQQSKDFRFRFHVVRIEVFKIQDGFEDIEGLMRLNPGEGKEYILGLVDALNGNGRRGSMIPIINLTWGDGLQTWFGCSGSHFEPFFTQPIDFVFSCYL